MNRRRFIQALLALPFVGYVVSKIPKRYSISVNVLTGDTITLDRLTGKRTYKEGINEVVGSLAPDNAMVNRLHNVVLKRMANQ